MDVVEVLTGERMKSEFEICFDAEEKLAHCLYEKARRDKGRCFERFIPGQCTDLAPPYLVPSNRLRQEARTPSFEHVPLTQSICLSLRGSYATLCTAPVIGPRVAVA